MQTTGDAGAEGAFHGDGPVRKRKMRFLPYLTFSVESSEAAEAIVRRLVQKTERPGWRIPKLPYCGEVGAGGFKVVPIDPCYRNSFMPVIHGLLDPQPSGTNVQITMRLHWVVILFLCGVCGFIAYSSIAILHDIVAGRADWSASFGPLLMLLLIAGLTEYLFWSEVPRRREDITQILRGPSTPQPDRG